MSDNLEAGALIDLLLKLNQQAMEGAHIEAAYHILNAALHVAIDAEDIARLHAIQECAVQQSRQIDEQYPQNPLSTSSVVQRHGVHMYQVLAQEASTRIRMIELEQKRRQRPDLFGSGSPSNE